MNGKALVSLEEARKKLTVSIYKVDCLLFGKFELSSGVTINAYLNLMTILSHPQVLDEVCQVACLVLKQKNLLVSNVCGVPYAGLPFAAVISDKLQVPLVLRLKELCFSPVDPRVVGNIRAKTEILVVEEVMCSGTSTIQAIKDLEDAGMIVKHVLTVVDLEQGAKGNLSEMGYQLHSILTLSKMADILHNQGLLDEKRMDEVREGWKELFAPNGDCISNTFLGERKLSKYESRLTQVKSNVSKRLFQLMSRKQTNLCVEILSSDLDSVLKIAEQIGPYICILSIHVDAFHSFDVSKAKELKRIALKHDFLILDDRKFSDEGLVLLHQLKKLLSLVDMVTVFPLLGESSLTEVKTVTEEMPEKGIFLVASCFTQDSLLKSSLERNIIKLGLTLCPSVVGFISHQNSNIPAGYVHMMPDLKTSATSAARDVCKPYYSEEVISHKLAADIVMMSLTCDSDTVDLVKKQRNATWLGCVDQLGEKA